MEKRLILVLIGFSVAQTAAAVTREQFTTAITTVKAKAQEQVAGEKLLDMKQQNLNQELLEAARAVSFGRVKKLLDKGAEVNASDRDGNTALIIVCSQNEPPVKPSYRPALTPWISMPGLVIYQGWSDFGGWYVQPVNSEIQKVANILITNQADVKAANKFGTTALMKACENGHRQAVSLILLDGATIHQVDKKERSAVFYAARGAQLALIKQFMFWGMKLTETDIDNFAARASQRNKNKLLSFLAWEGFYGSDDDSYGRLVRRLYDRGTRAHWFWKRWYHLKRTKSKKK